MPDIPLQSESEFTSDMVKAVENIAVNVKLGSAEFSDSIGMLSKAIDGLKSSLIDSINSLKSSANNSAPVSSSAAPRASQGRSPSAQDPAVARAKEEEKKIKAETRALNIKTAQERAIFNAKKLQLQIESVNEVKTTRRKKTDADTQQQTIEEVFENVGKGFGDVFAVTKEQVSAMTKIGKKGKKEKPFEMDMGSLATASKTAGSGVDLPKSFIIGASDASSAWKNVFNEITVETEKYRTNQEDISSLMDDIRSILGDATDQAQALSLEMEAALDPRTYLEQAQDALDSLAPPDVNEFEQLFNDLGAMFEGIIPNPGMNEGIIPNNPSIAEPVEPYYSPFIGMPEEQAPLVGPTQDNEARYNRIQEEDKAIRDGVNNFCVVFDAMFGKMGKSISNVVATTASGINRSFSDNSPIFDSIKSLAGDITSITPRQAASGVAGGARSAMGMVSSAFGGIRSLFSGSNTQENNPVETNQGFPGGINGDDLESTRPQPLSSGGTVGYFAKGTKKKSFLGTLFNTIDDVFGGFFGKKKKKKKDDDESIFKPKGTDTVPAMLTKGEEVVKKSAAEKPENKAAIDAMNMSSGGKVGYFAGGTPGGGGKGLVGGLASLALGPVGAAFSVLTGSVKAASDAIGMFGSFVAKNNPAVMEQVNLAMNDLQGAIGRALVPAVQALLPVLRYMGDGVDFVMKMLMPAINPLVSAFKTLAMPLIEMESVIAQFLAPAFEIVAVAVEGFAIMLDPVIQLVSEVVESFTQLLDSFLGGIPITKFMRDGFEVLGQMVKMLVGAIVGVLGLFMSGMGVILQLAGYLVQGFGMLIQGVGKLVSYIPGMGTLGAILTDAGTSVAAGGKSIVKSGEDLQKKGEDQRDRGLAKIKEGGENIIGKFTDPNYKMKDNTRYKPGDVTGVGMKKGSSVGASVREVQSTSISGVGDEIRKQALMAATGAKTQEESLAEIAKGLSKQNLADAVKAGVIAANADNKGGPPIVGGNNPMRKPQPLMAPV
jgi:phage-related protein